MSGTDTYHGAGARRAVTAAAILLAAAWAPAALAIIPAQVVATAHLRAGPSTFYPIVTVLPPGTPVQLFGCEQGWGWCDVAWGPNRGWVDAWMLQSTWGGGPVVVASSGAMMSVPIISFSFNNYWNTWYRGRPWFNNRTRYFNYWNRFPHGRPPPPRRRPIARPPSRPPPAVRPPPRPPQGSRPGNTRPGGGGNTRPPPGGNPPGQGRPPPSGNRPPARTSSGDRPAPQ
jgi:uncharacterized protein YraI